MKLNIKKLSFWLAIIMTVSLVLAGIFLVAGMATAKTNLIEVDEERSYDAGNIRNIKIDVGSMKINIMKNENENIRIRLHGRIQKSSRDVKIDDLVTQDELGIKIKQKFVLNLGVNLPYYNELQLDVLVPEKDLDMLQVICSSGDITSSIKGAANNSFEAHSGNIDITGLAGNLYAYCSSGNIRLENVNSKKNAEIKSSSGDIEIEKLTALELNVRSSSGKTTGNRITVTDARIKSSSGGIRINGFTGNIDTEVNSGNTEIHFDKFRDTNVVTKSDSGNTKIYLPGDSEFKIKTKLSSGKFNSDFKLTFEGFVKKNDFTGTCGDGGSNSINIRSSSGNVNVMKE